MSENQSESVAESKPYGRFFVAKVMLETLTRRGPVEFFRLTYVMLRFRLRSAYDDNTRAIVIGFHGVLGLAGAALLALAFGLGGGITATTVAARLGGAVVGFALLFVSGSWFLMPAFQRSVLLGEVVASVCYGFLCVVLCWFGWRHAIVLASSDPQTFSAFILLAVVVVVAFGHPLALFARFLVMRATANHYAFETAYHQILAVRPRRGGYRQTAVHEAGHALMYALGARIPDPS
ncbi:hypothetical protein [uncultured Ralstonia sp.]|uniref:hypothetical protein n=1 Tax=uncultured Ralstonia sp. TaxID=114715 RepID=UPI002638201A|nr:hypothetical protein [uncultured Ralstonia sp.]